MKKTPETVKSKVKKAIKEFLIENGKTRANKIRDEIVPKMCSEKIFWDCISELYRIHEIEKQIQPPNKVWYGMADQLHQENQWLDGFTYFEKDIKSDFQQLKEPSSSMTNPPTLDEETRYFFWVFTRIMHQYALYTFLSQRADFSKQGSFKDILEKRIPKLVESSKKALDIVIKKHLPLIDVDGKDVTRDLVLLDLIELQSEEQNRNFEFSNKLLKKLNERLLDEGKITLQQFLDQATLSPNAFGAITEKK